MVNKNCRQKKKNKNEYYKLDFNYIVNYKLILLNRITTTTTTTTYHSEIGNEI